MSSDELLKAADHTMYEVKQRRRDGKPRGAKPEVMTSSTPPPV